MTENSSDLNNKKDFKNNANKKNDNKDEEWLFIRMKYVMYNVSDEDKCKQYENEKDGGGKRIKMGNGDIIVIDCKKFIISGKIKSDGSGTIETSNNSSHKSLNKISKGNDPIFVQNDKLYAFILDCDIEAEIYQLSCEIFQLPKLTYIKTKPIVGPSKNQVLVMMMLIVKIVKIVVVVIKIKVVDQM